MPIPILVLTCIDIKECSTELAMDMATMKLRLGATLNITTIKATEEGTTILNNWKMMNKAIHPIIDNDDRKEFSINQNLEEMRELIKMIRRGHKRTLILNRLKRDKVKSKSIITSKKLLINLSEKSLT
jgi:lipoate synthase